MKIHQKIDSWISDPKKSRYIPVNSHLHKGKRGVRRSEVFFFKRITQLMEITYRPACDEDADGLISLVDKCFKEYEGCILDVDAEEPQLRYIATYYKEKDGEFWVAEKEGRIIGSIGYVPDDRRIELKHLYVNSDIRRQGLATHLCEMVEEAAKKRDASSIILWTDTRFINAHRLYEKRGYDGGTETRILQDLSKTVEYYYEKILASR